MTGVDTGRGALAERLDVLAGCYAFTSRLLLAPPDPDLIARLREPGLLAGWPLRDDRSAEGVRLLLDGTRAPALDLGRDFQRLFVGPGHPLAPPYESVHRTADHLVFDEQTAQVREFYRRLGRVAPALNREPDDHLGLELDFLSHLSVRALDAIDAGDVSLLDALLATQQTFLTEHVLCWAGDVTALITEHARTDFYRGTAALVDGVLAEATRTLVPGDPDR